MKLLLENWRKFINEEYEPITTLRIFDFDETIAHTESETRVKAPDGTEATLRDQEEFETYMRDAAAKEGVTALQMDIKVQGITAEIMESALEKAKNARMHILEKMNDVISAPKELSDNTPAMKKITVHQDKIKEIIGKGGAVIKGMQADTGASVDVNDDGVVTIFGETQSIMKAALEIIEGIIEDPELDKVYEGTVVKIVDFGAFVNILPGKDGLLHVSEISSERVENVSDVLSEGDVIKVKLIGFDRGKMKLSKKVLESDT